MIHMSNHSQRPPAAARPENPALASSGLGRYRYLPKPVKAVYLAAPLVALGLFIIHWFSIPVFGQVLAGIPYYYLMYAVLGVNVFLGLGATRKDKRRAPPWYDYALVALLWVLIGFFLLNADDIAYHNWVVPPSGIIIAAAVAMGLLAIEAGRRVGRLPYAIIMFVSILYPLVAESSLLANNLGGVFYGVSFPLEEIFGSFAFGADGMLGMPARILGELVLGFFLFAGLVMGIGGGEFFIKLATSLMGRVRGGQAKGAVLASALFGSITGSAIANVAGTGSFTIPAMKKAGYTPEYAASIEACSSAGSDTVPPVMGGLVFIMVIIFGVDYADVVVAALLPSALFYLGLLVQVDSYAARHKLKAPADTGDMPPWWKVLAGGWTYVAGIGMLIFGLVYMRWGAITPIYAATVVIGLQVLEWGVKRLWPRSSGETRPPLRDSLERATRKAETGLAQTAGLINYAAAIFIGIGFIMVGLLKTGVAAGLAGWIIGVGAGNLYLVLFVCFLFSNLMGLAGLERTGYILLAVIAVPAIVALSKTAPEFAAYGGIPLIGINLFLIFYAALGGITPPVALHSYVAANIAGADPVKTSWLACRLGAVLFFIPFFFVLQPALLIIYTPWWETLARFALVAAGIWVLSSALEGYLIGVGILNRAQRFILFAGGFMLAFPLAWTFATGVAICAGTIAATLYAKRKHVQTPGQISQGTETPEPYKESD